MLIAAGIGIYWSLDLTKDEGLIYSNVYIFDLNLGGMTPEDAKSAVSQLVSATYPVQNLTIELPDSTLVLSPGSTNITVDIDALIEDAYAYGRTGSRWERTQAKAAAMLTSYNLEVLDYMSVNVGYIRQVVEQLAQTAESMLVQSTVTVEGEIPALDRLYDEAVADKNVEHLVMTITMGTPYRHLDVDGLIDRILNAYASNNFDTIHADYTVMEPDTLDLERLFTEHCVVPINAILDETTYIVTPEVLGYGFEVEALTEQLAEVKPGEEVEITFTYLPAEVTQKSLEEHLFQDVLAEVHTDHVYNPNRTHNLTLAANAINGTILRPGETFSFNRIVGERTEEKGYKGAPIYVGEATEDGVGGGICQVASTI